MGALGEPLADFEAILIGLVDLVELLHEVGLAVFGGPVVGAAICCVDHLLLLVPSDHQDIISNTTYKLHHLLRDSSSCTEDKYPSISSHSSIAFSFYRIIWSRNPLRSSSDKCSNDYSFIYSPSFIWSKYSHSC